MENAPLPNHHSNEGSKDKTIMPPQPKTPQQTLDKFTESINARAGIVVEQIEDRYTPLVVGFGMPKKKDPPPEISCKIYQHIYEVSEEYATPEEAVADLIKRLEAGLPEKIDELFWRVKPCITENMDFGMEHPMFVARTRFTYY